MRVQIGNRLVSTTERKPSRNRSASPPVDRSNCISSMMVVAAASSRFSALSRRVTARSLDAAKAPALAASTASVPRSSVDENTATVEERPRRDQDSAIAAGDSAMDHHGNSFGNEEIGLILSSRSTEREIIEDL